jgi:hypothetical protein
VLISLTKRKQFQAERKFTANSENLHENDISKRLTLESDTTSKAGGLVNVTASKAVGLNDLDL